MRTFDIDKEIEDILYAVRWDKDEENALNKAIVQLQDPEYLNRFFMKNQEKLNFFDCTVTEAVTRTHGQTNRFLQEIRTRAKMQHYIQPRILMNYLLPYIRRQGTLISGSIRTIKLPDQKKFLGFAYMPSDVMKICKKLLHIWKA